MLAFVRMLLAILFFVSSVVFAQSTHLWETKTVAAVTPTVQLKHAHLFDPICSNKNAYPIASLWVEELNKQLPEWQSAWNQQGKLLLSTAIKIIRKSFPQNHYIIPLSLCNFPSMSEPLIVNVRFSLSTFTKKHSNINVTISTIEHEILHTYIDAILPKETPLLMKYRNQSPTVLSHLHLFALQKAIYLTLNQNAILRDVISKDSSLPNDEYKQAWKIVNKEGHVSFINELKKYQINTRNFAQDKISARSRLRKLRSSCLEG